MPGNMIDVELAGKYPLSHTLSPVYQKCLDAYVRLRRSLPAAVFSKVIHGVYDGKTVGVIPLNREKKSAAQNR